MIDKKDAQSIEERIDRAKQYLGYAKGKVEEAEFAIQQLIKEINKIVADYKLSESDDD